MQRGKKGSSSAHPSGLSVLLHAPSTSSSASHALEGHLEYLISQSLDIKNDYLVSLHKYIYCVCLCVYEQEQMAHMLMCFLSWSSRYFIITAWYILCYMSFCNHDNHLKAVNTHNLSRLLNPQLCVDNYSAELGLIVVNNRNPFSFFKQNIMRNY